MASFSSSFIVGSTSSAQSVRDVISSYRRAQYFVAGSTLPAPGVSDNEVDEEAAIGGPQDDEYDDSLDATTPKAAEEFVGQFQWDDEGTEEGSGPQRPVQTVQPAPYSGRERAQRQKKRKRGTGSVHRAGPAILPTEETPLLRKISFSTTPHPRRVSVTTPLVNDTAGVSEQQNAPSHGRIRRTSTASSKAITYSHAGRSTFGQTLFNSIAILVGIGMLSEPLAFSYAGWGLGTLLIVSYGFISCYTAKILAKIIMSDPRLRSYSDIGRKVFGPRSTTFISLMFCLELFAVSVVLVTLYGDSLHAILPTRTANDYKLWGIFILLPTVFLPLSLLSYTSILGILSTILIVVVIFIDGVSKREAPGSLWEPGETSWNGGNARQLGVAFGLFMAGFSGHAVIPSLARDMIDPSQFDRMINWAFLAATLIYTLIGWAGYRMFGKDVSEEFSMDLLRTPGYSHQLNLACLWMLVISPLTKFALTTQPLNATIEYLLGIDSPCPSTAEESGSRSNSINGPIKSSNEVVRRISAILQRVAVTCLSVTVAITVPEFSALMAFLGSFSAFMLCIIGPISAKVVLEGRCNLFDASLLCMATIMAIWGTWAAVVASG